MKYDSPVKIISDDFDHASYDKAVKHPLQSWQWGNARQEMGIELLRISEFKNKESTNAFQLTFHKIPYTNFKVGYLPRSVFPSKQVLEFLADYARKNNVFFIKIEPYELASFWGAERLQNRSDQRFRTAARYAPKQSVAGGSRNDGQTNLVKSHHPLFPSWTQILDLTKSEDELLKGMHHKTRYNIRLAQKKGVVVKEMSNDEGFKIFSKLYFETCKRQKYFGHSPNYHKILWNNLKKNISHILIAFYNKTPLAAYELFHFQDRLYYPYGGTSLEHRNLMASNLLMWETIRFGKNLGATKFDMWGSLPQKYNPYDPWAGFTKFKEGYGGDFVEFVGSYDLIINPTAYRVYNTSYFFRKLYLKIKKL